MLPSCHYVGRPLRNYKKSTFHSINNTNFKTQTRNKNKIGEVNFNLQIKKEERKKKITSWH